MTINALRRSGLLSILALLLVLPATAAARAEVSIAVDVATGKVLEQKDATAHWYPASTTKLMTAYLALKALRDDPGVALDSPVIMTRRAAAEAPSKMGFEPGSVMRLDNAMRMMLVKSANDIAYAIGQMLADGSMEAFVVRMNDEARRLGMKDTRFVNPNGLPQPGQYSSARDLALLAMAIRRDFPAFLDYFGTEAISLNGKIFKNGNGLLGRFPGADGMKTGYICASGFNLVSSATRDGRTVVAVVLGAVGSIGRERMSAEILHKAFETDPATVDVTIDQLQASTGEPVDISKEVCSAAGRTARANERKAEANRKEPFGSPYTAEMDRPPVAVQVALGGAAGNALAEPGITLIAAYGIPTPTARPFRPEDIINSPPVIVAGTPEDEPVAVASAIAEKTLNAADAAGPVATTVNTADKSARHGEVPIPQFAERATN
ncbi:D-alanyl-D-alanine carboxypeptidase family protein [Consotaella aegiceratis]|uniref:D-alanyl-D-alanine carboxypeptidase family protein n=1 Tax=Consotaella aegiceratis TaxID=3097961 RepID=UPI002F3F97B0